jgi:hypothetical protein
MPRIWAAISSWYSTSASSSAPSRGGKKGLKPARVGSSFSQVAARQSRLSAMSQMQFSRVDRIKPLTAYNQERNVPPRDAPEACAVIWSEKNNQISVNGVSLESKQKLVRAEGCPVSAVKKRKISCDFLIMTAHALSVVASKRRPSSFTH